MKINKDTEETDYDNYHDKEWYLDETSNVIMELNKDLIVLSKEDKEYYHFLKTGELTIKPNKDNV